MDAACWDPASAMTAWNQDIERDQYNRQKLPKDEVENSQHFQL